MIETAIEIHEHISINLVPMAGDQNTAITADVRDSSTDDTASLSSILDEAWIGQVSEQDPRFTKALEPGDGTLEDRVEKCIADPNASTLKVPAVIRSIENARQVVARIEAQALEEQLRELLSALLRTTESSRIDALAMRLGWAGTAPKTLQECGDLLGITRERIRQIESKLIARLPEHPVFLPKLDQALALLEKNAPIELEEAARLLANHSISKKPFSPVSVIQSAKLLGHKTTLTVQCVRGVHVVAGTLKAKGLSGVVHMARKLAGRAGVASVFQVSDELISPDRDKPPKRSQIKEEDIRRLLKQISECEFLDEDWFWFTDIPEGRNRLCNITERILSVASPQSISSIREGIRRAFRFRSLSQPAYRSLTVPPIAVIEKFFCRYPTFKVDRGQVEPIKSLNYERLLGETEQTFVNVFRTSPSSVLDRQTLVEACISKGLNENTISMYTTYSPILEHLGIDVWKLRGVLVDPSTVEALREQKQLRFRETRLLEYGWTPEGQLWIAWRIPRLVSNIVLGIPGAVRRYLSGQSFVAVAKDTGRPCGNIGINDQGSSYGYGPFLRYAGADADDVLLTEFDLPTSTVRMSIADADLLDESK